MHEPMARKACPHPRGEGQADRCSIAATLPRRSDSRFSRARRLLRTRGVVDVDHHAVEERIDLRAQPREAAEHGDVVARARARGRCRRGRLDRFGQLAFGRLVEQRRIDRRRDLAVDLAQDVADALVGGGQRLGFRQLGELADGVEAAVEVVAANRGATLATASNCVHGDALVGVVAAQAVEDEVADLGTIASSRLPLLPFVLRSARPWSARPAVRSRFDAASCKISAESRSNPLSIIVRASPSALRRNANGSLLPGRLQPRRETARQRVQPLGDRQHLAQRRQRDVIAGEARL